MLASLGQLLQHVLYLPWRNPSLLDQSNLVSQYRDSGARLFLFDWDGTLTPIVRDPAAAVPTPTVINILQTISTPPKNSFWIISGRDPDFLEQHFSSVPSIGLSAEHGAFVRRPGHTDWEDTSGSVDKAWQHQVMRIFEKFTAETPGSVIERKNVSITWHYRNAEPEKGAIDPKECRRRLEEALGESSAKLEVMNGKMCLEVRPRSVSKGVIVQRILSDYCNHHEQPSNPDFLLVVGDDVTDEGWFGLPLYYGC